MNRTAFDAFVRDLARYGDALTPEAILPRLTPGVVQAWLDAEIADNDGSPSWVLSDLMDEFTNAHGKSGDREQAAHVVLDALTKPDPQAVVWYSLADALRWMVARAAARKIETELWLGRLLDPLKTSIEHYDAIGADRRAMVRGDRQ